MTTSYNNSLLKQYKNGWIVIKKENDNYPPHISIQRNIIPSITILLLGVLIVIWLYRKPSDFFEKIKPFNFKKLIGVAVSIVLALFLVTYAIMNLYNARIPILIFSPDYFCYDSSFNRTTKVYWDTIRFVELKKIKSGKHYSWILQFKMYYGADVSIRLGDIEASPYALAQYITQYKTLLVQDTFVMRLKLTSYYDFISRYRGLLYLIIIIILFLRALQVRFLYKNNRFKKNRKNQRYKNYA